MQNADVLDYIGEPNFKICLLQLAFQSVEIAKKKFSQLFQIIKKGHEFERYYFVSFVLATSIIYNLVIIFENTQFQSFSRQNYNFEIQFILGFSLLLTQRR